LRADPRSREAVGPQGRARECRRFRAKAPHEAGSVKRSLQPVG
jgi:hypothetical protein